jgi:hypothetical protein
MKREHTSTTPTAKQIRARLDRQRPSNTYSPKLYYEDTAFTCRDCGAKCVWTAEQQRRWYEEWKGPIQSRAVRCRVCRDRLRREKAAQRQHMQQMAAKRRTRANG